jgi:DNA-binding NarL/FixJ family response regulator
MGAVLEERNGGEQSADEMVRMSSPPEFKTNELSAGQRTLIVVATLGTLSDSLVAALRREFPWLVVEQVESVEAAWRAFDHPVSLILIDALSVRRTDDSLVQLPKWHPNSLTVLMEHGDRCTDTLHELLDHDHIQGVLPMDLRLNIWLSVMRVMLRGGEYFPLSLLRGAGSQLVAAPYPRRESLSRPHSPGGSGSAPRFFDLTRREIQILEQLSRGAQNKTIAAIFDLSEHTVKIHVHNIIAKMGISNRTEAAARFRDYCPLPEGPDIG